MKVSQSSGDTKTVTFLWFRINTVITDMKGSQIDDSKEKVDGVVHTESWECDQAIVVDQELLALLAYVAMPITIFY